MKTTESEYEWVSRTDYTGFVACNDSLHADPARRYNRSVGESADESTNFIPPD